MSDDIKEPKLRVLLWTAPRFCGTVFTKCMSFVDGVQPVKEPFTIAKTFGPERDLVTASQNAFDKTFGKYSENPPDLSKSTAYDESTCTFAWVKYILESEFKGKKLLFCHDQAFCLKQRYEMLPRGFRHTFLIRHPYRVFPSWKKMMIGVMPSHAGRPFSDMPESALPPKRGYGELFDLLTYVKEHGIEKYPVIVDADDLLQHPESILRQYCEALGIPFRESILEWEAGDKIVDTWIMSNVVRQWNRVDSGSCFVNAVKSTKFIPPSEMPSREDLESDLLPLADFVMPYYHKLYDMRIRP